MLELLWLIPALPFAGFLALALVGSRLPRAMVALLGVGSVGLSAAVAIGVGVAFVGSGEAAYTQTLWTWLDVDGFRPEVAFYLDALSLVMVLVVTGVGFLIHLYSAEFMLEEEGYHRFFAYMNLFVGSMLVLLLADDLLLLYLGWEGVGLCSYLLIGFWYQDPQNGQAARKAFIVTRVGDTAMAIGLFLLFTHLGTLQIQELMQRAEAQWSVGSTLAVAAAALLLGGAVGKSAQLPLQTWLPDAMAGPTPVSALIHAATMVTAGVYLIARTHVLFLLAPTVQGAVAVIGALTLLLAGFSALVQSDIKRVLAYSTISQIGYMFLALGVGAWSAAIFHFMTHAFFKALLFLGAGVVIFCLHHEHNLFNMGGLRTQLPVTFWTFLAGAAALAALPLVTAGFYSKDLILWEAWAQGHPGLWAAGWVGAVVTSIYTTRLVVLAFLGEAKGHVTRQPGPRLQVPLILLAVLSLVGGFVELPHNWVHFTPFSDWMASALPEAPGSLATSATGAGGTEWAFQALAAAGCLGGIGLALWWFRRRPGWAEGVAGSPIGAFFHRWWFAGWGFDGLYETLFVRPLVWLARVNQKDCLDFFYLGLAWLHQAGHGLLVRTQTGQVRWYAMGIALGAAVIVAIAVFL